MCIRDSHDGDLERAKLLIRLCAEAGADAAKFQNFRAAKIVSERGFKSMGGQLSHQSKWKKSVFQVYREATLPWEWTPDLKRECEACGIEYFSAPYDLEAVDMLDPYVSLFKIGSGDITCLLYTSRIVGIDYGAPRETSETGGAGARHRQNFGQGFFYQVNIA